MDSSTTIVIPAFNEEMRLPQTLADLQAKIRAGAFGPLQIKEILVIDDGSTDQTQACAEEFGRALPGFRVHRYENNRGKGYAVRQGLEQATQAWVLIADADQATPWEESQHLSAPCLERGFDIAIGSRDVIGSQRLVHQSFLRENLGRCFNLFVRLMLGLPFKDTQCGFKLIHREAARKFLDQLSVERFAWDVELLFLAKENGLKITEVPVRWEHKEGSRISVGRDGLEMVMTTLRLRGRRIARRVRIS